MKRWDERAICSSLSLNRMAKMPEILEPIGRPSVITRENDPVNLQLHKAYYIRKYKPELNSREECTELNDLLF